MVEVLVDGQFGYCGTHNLSYEAINNAAQKASIQAKMHRNIQYVHLLKKLGQNQLVNTCQCN